MIASNQLAKVSEKEYEDINSPYSGFAKIYDRVMGNAAFTVIRRSFELAIKKYNISFKSAADIGCGTGRFLRYLRSYGISVFGVDKSPAMIRIASEKNRDSGVKLFRQDITRLKLPQPVDLITCNFDTLNYILSIKDLQRVLSRCHSNLNDNGHFIFDIISGSQDGEGWQRVIQKIRMPGLFSTWFISWSPRDRVSIIRMNYFFKKRTGGYENMKEVHIQRWYPPSLISRLLKNSGFKVRGIHDAETFLPAIKQTFWAKYIARKTD